MVNTAGGITGGDRFEIAAEVVSGTALTLTTQTAERAYRAQPGETGQLSSALRVGPKARLQWLPQETILFDGSSLDRRLDVDLAVDAQLLLVEPLIFGRTEMGEALTQAWFRDHIDIRRDGKPLFLDRTEMTGDIAAHLARPHITNGALAMALIVLVAPEAGTRLDALRCMLPETAGAGLIGPDVLVTRLLAADGFDLRQTLVPVLRFLSNEELPKCWML